MVNPNVSYLVYDRWKQMAKSIIFHVAFHHGVLIRIFYLEITLGINCTTVQSDMKL